MRILVIADPLDQIKPGADTTLSLITESMSKGHDVWWSTGDDVELVDYQPVARASEISSMVPQHLPELASPASHPMTDFNVVLVRKNPPFDASYVKLCWFLQPFERHVVISNRPSLLLRFHEKMVPYQAVAAGALAEAEIVPTCVSRHPETLRAFMQRHENDAWVVKPWMGYGGRQVEKFTNRDEVIHAMQHAEEPLMVSPFLPEVVTEGDRRVFFIGGTLAGDIVRMPRAGGFISNLAVGGKGELRPMSAATQDRCERLGKFLGEAGCDFAGADVIGEYISEVNVTSPTGIVNLQDLGGKNLAPDIMGHIIEHGGR